METKGNFPTARQISYANDISEILKIDLPVSNTRAAYNDFIIKYEEDYLDKTANSEFIFGDYE